MSRASPADWWRAGVVLQQKDDLHVNGMIQMQAMRRTHNENLQTLHARISSLENEVTALQQVSS
jgi:hypothetical protein